MLSLTGSLSALLEAPAVVGAVLADAVTGLTYATAGDYAATGDGAELAELANLITDSLHEAGATGEFESLIVTSASTHQVVQVLPPPRDALMLALVLDRSETNLALAIRQAADLATGLLA